MSPSHSKSDLFSSDVVVILINHHICLSIYSSIHLIYALNPDQGHGVLLPICCGRQMRGEEHPWAGCQSITGPTQRHPIIHAHTHIWGSFGICNKHLCFKSPTHAWEKQSTSPGLTSVKPQSFDLLVVRHQRQPAAALCSSKLQQAGETCHQWAEKKAGWKKQTNKKQS